MPLVRVRRRVSGAKRMRATSLDADQDYENIVFEGGGVHGFGYIGCIEQLEQRQKRAAIRRVAGASIGSLMGFAFACGVSAEQLLIDAQSLTREHLTGDIGRVRAMYNLLRYWGLYDLRTSITPWLTDIIYRYTGGSNTLFTFDDLYQKFGRDLFIIIYNCTRSRLEVKSRHSSPDLPVFDVLIAALSYPGYFMPVRLPGSDDLYVDGGMVNNFPIYLFDDEQFGGDGFFNPRTLGIRSVSDQSVYFSSDINYQQPPPTTLVQYFEALVSISIESGQQRYEQPRDASRTYFMKMPHAINSMDFGISTERKNDMYTIGHLGMGAYLDQQRIST